MSEMLLHLVDPIVLEAVDEDTLRVLQTPRTMSMQSTLSHAFKHGIAPERTRISPLPVKQGGGGFLPADQVDPHGFEPADNVRHEEPKRAALARIVTRIEAPEGHPAICPVCQEIGHDPAHFSNCKGPAADAA
jgi:hypothetical protein